MTGNTLLAVVINLFFLQIFAVNLNAGEARGGPASQQSLATFELDCLAAKIGKDGEPFVRAVLQAAKDVAIHFPGEPFQSTVLKQKGLKARLDYFADGQRIQCTRMSLSANENTQTQLNDFVRLAIAEGKVLYSFDPFDEIRERMSPETRKALLKRKPEEYKFLLTRDPTWYLIQNNEWAAFSVEILRIKEKIESVSLWCPPRLPETERREKIPGDIQKKLESLGKDYRKDSSYEFLGAPICGNEEIAILAARFLKSDNSFALLTGSPVCIQFTQAVKMTSYDTEFFFKKGMFYGLYTQITPRGNPKEMAQQFIRYLKNNFKTKKEALLKGLRVTGGREIKVEQQTIFLLWRLEDAVEMAMFSSSELPEPSRLEQFIDPGILNAKDRNLLLCRRIKTLTEQIESIRPDDKSIENEWPDSAKKMLQHLFAVRAFNYFQVGSYGKAMEDVTTCKKLGGTVDEQFLKRLDEALKDNKSNTIK